MNCQSLANIAVGNVFFKASDPTLVQKHPSIFSIWALASLAGVRCPLTVPRSILGPAASSTEPVVLRPFVVPAVEMEC
jgi:glutamate synthase (NADPH/NADH)